ncbi:MFS transporter [Paraburkholderia guartelaensis]|uniref:MFS transporter n=1 Tax=Paraburkholderia guartelaensis TaxID=2546446 RepID=UPI002AB6DF05|nr:MFS transporter [Paraburkholderia guartelaensis]
MKEGTASVDVGAAIEGGRLRRFHFQLVFWSMVIMVFDGFDQQMIGYVAPSVIRAWHIASPAFVPVFTTSMVGMMLGATLGGSAADRYGRRTMMIAGMAVFGLFTLAAAWATTIASLSVLRLLAGIGVGFAVPNALALTAEYAPKRQRATLITIMFLGYTIGGAAGGWAAAALIPRFGWPAMFVVGGVLPLALLPAAFFVLPESIRFQLLRHGDVAAVREKLARIVPDLRIGPDTRLVAREEVRKGQPVCHLFTEGRASFTLLLWITFVANLMTLTFVMTWLPTVIANAGIPLTRAVIVSSFFQVGGIVGGVVISRLLDRGTIRPLAAFFGGAALSIALIGSIGNNPLLLDCVVFAAGLFVVGGQFGLNALASSAYPTFIRSTGTGWAMGIGRLGAIIGPVIGGILISLALPQQTLFLYGAVPMLTGCAAIVAMITKGRHEPRDADVQQPIAEDALNSH